MNEYKVTLLIETPRNLDNLENVDDLSQELYISPESTGEIRAKIHMIIEKIK